MACVFLFFTLPIYSQQSETEEVLASRGKGVVLQTDLVARAEKIPADIRFATLRDGKRMRDVINSLLLVSQLVADARESGFEKNQIVQDRMRLAANAELAEAWIQHYVESQPPADYEQLARENYELNQERMLSSPRYDISHILISTENRTEEQALDMAEGLYQKLSDNPELFNEYVLEYSEDPSVSSNKGMFKNVKQGDMVKSFEEKAFALKIGEISSPVKTPYGYHIIRLDNIIPSHKLEYQEVKDILIDTEKKKHQDRIRSEYLSSLTSLNVEMTKESLESALKKLFGEENFEPEVADDNSE